MDKDISKCIEIYKNQLLEGDIQIAYLTLMRYMSELKSKFSKQYSTGNISFGYLDYTYFPFYNEYLRKYKLKFGIVLNHKKMQIELWLMGRNATVQKEYWNILKNTDWNKHAKVMPKYSVLDICLEDRLDFKHKENMTGIILDKSESIAVEIQSFIEEKNCEKPEH